MGYIDVKLTIWERYYINDEDITSELKNKKPDISNLMGESYQQEFIYESWEHMTPEENGNQSTTEIFNENGGLIWTNKPIEEIRDEKINEITKD